MSSSDKDISLAEVDARARASEWLAVLKRPERAPEIEAAFRAWLSAHPANRKAFDNAIGRAMAQMAQEPEAVALLLCDIDNFKAFNDNWGHQTGDQVLRLVANCLAENVKGRDTAARYGGEEFAVLLRGTGLEAASQVAEQIRHAVQTKKLVKKSTGEVLGHITTSIGVAQFAPGEAAEAAIRRADACLYGAKSHGRNLVVNQDDARVAMLETSAA